jgi:hypothetical protein
MRSYFRNLLAALRGRRAQASIASVVSSFEQAAQQLNRAQDALVLEQFAIDEQAHALLTRSNEIVLETRRARRLSEKLTEFTR